MINESGFGKRLDEQMKKAGYSNSQLTKALNVSKNAIGNYKNNQIPNATILYELSHILGTTMEYLLTGINENQLTMDERQLLDAYRSADARGKENILWAAKREENQGKALDCKIG